jgi:hypothetical protein
MKKTSAIVKTNAVRGPTGELTSIWWSSGLCPTNNGGLEKQNTFDAFEHENSYFLYNYGTITVGT